MTVTITRRATTCRSTHPNPILRTTRCILPDRHRGRLCWDGTTEWARDDERSGA